MHHTRRKAIAQMVAIELPIKINGYHEIYSNRKYTDQEWDRAWQECEAPAWEGQAKSFRNPDFPGLIHLATQELQESYFGEYSGALLTKLVKYLEADASPLVFYFMTEQWDTIRYLVSVWAKDNTETKTKWWRRWKSNT